MPIGMLLRPEKQDAERLCMRFAPGATERELLETFVEILPQRYFVELPQKLTKFFINLMVVMGWYTKYFSI
jgi:hypothetical protein